MLVRQRLMFGESLQSVKRRAPVVELSSAEQAKRGKAKTVKPKGKRLKTLRQWAAAHKHYTKGDLKNKANLLEFAVTSNLTTGIAVDERIHRIFCTLCEKHVPSDKKTRINDHFGFGSKVSKGHERALLAAQEGNMSRQTQLASTPATAAATLAEFRTDFVYLLLASGINASQAEGVRQLLQKWGLPGFGNSLPNTAIF